MMRPASRRTLTACFVIALLAAVGRAQGHLRYAIAGLDPSDEFGVTTESMGDINGDGIRELVVTAPFADVNGVDSGAVGVYSGADGSQLLLIAGDGPGFVIGSNAAGIGDVNGDDVPDLLIGTSNEGTAGMDAGSVRVCSGVDGSTIYEVFGDAAGDRLGTDVAAVGDIDGDLIEDFIAGANRPASPTGYARVYSGLTGSVLLTLTAAGGIEFGFALAGGGDFDGDTVPDLLVSDFGNLALAGAFAGRITVFSGATGAVIRTLGGAAANEFFGYSLDVVPDATGDGVPEILGSSFRFSGVGYARLFNGDTGLPMFTVSTGVQFDGFGHAVSFAGDVNGDGDPDIAVGSPRTGSQPGVPFRAGAIFFYSAVNGQHLATAFGNVSDGRVGYAVTDLDDVNGDGLDDVAAGLHPPPPAIGGAKVYSAGAAYGYGVGQPGTQTIDLRFDPGVTGMPAAGLLVGQGAAPGALGAVLLGTATTTGVAAGVAVHVSTFPGTYVVAQFGYGPTGLFLYPLNIRQPVLAGQMLHLQLFEAAAGAPQGLLGSNGLTLLFTL